MAQAFKSAVPSGYWAYGTLSINSVNSWILPPILGGRFTSPPPPPPWVYATAADLQFRDLPEPPRTSVLNILDALFSDLFFRRCLMRCGSQFGSILEPNLEAKSHQNPSKSIQRVIWKTSNMFHGFVIEFLCIQHPPEPRKSSSRRSGKLIVKILPCCSYIDFQTNFGSFVYRCWHHFRSKIAPIWSSKL